MRNSLILALALNACAPAAQIQRGEGMEMIKPFSKVRDHLSDTRDTIQSSCGLADGQFSLTAISVGKERGNFSITALSAEQKACAERIARTAQTQDGCGVDIEEKDDRLLIRGTCK